MASRILRPLTYGELFDEMFDLYKKNFVLYAGIAAVLFVPTMVLNILFVNVPILKGLVTIIAAIGQYAVIGAITRAVAQTYLGHNITIAESYEFMKGKFGLFFLTMLVTGLICGLGLCLLIIPGIIFLFWYAFVSEVYVIEGLNGGDARNRSKQLAAGFWGQIFVVGLITVLLYYVIVLVLSTPLIAVYGVAALRGGSFAVNTMTSIMSEVVDGIATIVVAPLSVLAFVLLYFDVRVRKEGFDLELLAQNLGTTPTAQASEVSASYKAQYQPAPPPSGYTQPQAQQPPAQPQYQPPAPPPASPAESWQNIPKEFEEASGLTPPPAQPSQAAPPPDDVNKTE